jgi:hypothetical protein
VSKKDTNYFFSIGTETIAQCLNQRFRKWDLFGYLQNLNTTVILMKFKIPNFFPNTLLLPAFLIICCTFMESCSTTAATQITGTWKDPEARNYKDFFVAVLSKNLPARSALEQNISARLKREGVKVTQSLDVFSHSDKVETPEEKKAAVEKIQSLGHDAIITVAVVRQTEESRYVPGANSYTPTNIGFGTGYFQPMTGRGVPGPGTYGPFGTYYTSASSAYTTPGYYETDKIYFLESRVYDAGTSRLVWSAQSETFNPTNINSASEDFALAMVTALKKANLIYKEKK